MVHFSLDIATKATEQDGIITPTSKTDPTVIISSNDVNKIVCEHDLTPRNEHCDGGSESDKDLEDSGFVDEEKTDGNRIHPNEKISPEDTVTDTEETEEKEENERTKKLVGNRVENSKGKFLRTLDSHKSKYIESEI